MSFELNKIYNQDCFETMCSIAESDVRVNCVITSPPYNTSSVAKLQSIQRQRLMITHVDMIFFLTIKQI